VDMAKKNGTDGRAMTKMDAVRAILLADSQAKASDISQRAKSQYGLEISPKMAATYRYHIQREGRKKERKAARAAAGPATADQSGGIDHLLKAGRTLGWRRVKEIVDSLVETPA